MESLLLNAKNPSNTIAAVFMKVFMLPAKLVFFGLKRRFMEIFFLTSISVIIIFAVLFFWNIGIIPRLPPGFFILLFLGFPVFITVFRMPSLYTHNWITDEQINKAKEIIKNFDIANDELESLRMNFSIFKNNFEQRIKSIRMPILILWGAYTFIFAKIYSKVFDKNLSSIPSPALEELIGSFFFILSIFLILDAYALGQRTMFNLMEFAFNELKVEKQEAEEENE
jgi:hypothetical protein